MSISIAKSVKKERLRWILPLIEKKIKLKELASVCPHSERTLKRWKKAYLEYGEEGLIPLSTTPNEMVRIY